MPPHASPSAPVSILARQNPQATVELLERLTPAQIDLWRRLGPEGLRVSDLDARMPAASLTRELATLEAMGLVVLERAIGEQGDAALPDPTPEETRLLEARVELDIPQKRQILRASRLIENGQWSELLDLPATSSRRQLKRAYFQLSKDFHPDRYFGKELGEFREVLERMFTALSQFVKTLGDSRTLDRNGPHAGGPSRRSYERYPLQKPVMVKCESWTAPAQVVSVNLSEGGIFVSTELSSIPGETIHLRLEHDHGPVLATGTIISVRNSEIAKRDQRYPGLGVRFRPLKPEHRQRLMHMLALAREDAPRLVRETIPSSPSARQHMAHKSAIIHGRDPIIGIDLGTTNTSISGVLGNKVHILRWPNGQTSIPSAVAFPERGRCVVGAAARQQALRDPRLAVLASKRLLGRQLDDHEVASFLAQARFDHHEGPDGTVVTTMWGDDYAIPQLCSYLFAAAKHTASKALGARVQKAVLTVPVTFSRNRSKLMARAAKLAHLDVVDILEEPSAAALANRGQDGFRGTVGVYDFGGGTFDFSIVQSNGGDLRVLATTGDSWLGGDDFDQAIADAVADTIWRAHQIDLRQRAVEWQYLLQSSERAKCKLSQVERSEVIIPDVLRTRSGTKDVRVGVRRENVEPLWRDAIDRSLATCMQGLALADLAKDDLDAIYLCGGTSYIPAVRQALEKRFEIPVHQGLAPEHAVCAGAGIHAAQLERQNRPALRAR